MSAQSRAETKTEIERWGREYRETDFGGPFAGTDWQTYVPRLLRLLWTELSDETRGAVYFQAEAIASREGGE